MNANNNRSIFNKVSIAWRHRNTLRKVLARHAKFLQDNSTNEWGSITEEEEAGIHAAIDYSKHLDGPIVEIGTLFGHTTALIACLKGDNRTIVTLDNYSWNPFCLPAGDHRLFTRRTLRYLIEKAEVSLVDADAQDFYEKYDGPTPSMVFIDADHRYEGVKRDIEWAIRIGVPVISGHDYDDESPDVKRAVNELFGNSIETYGSVWIHK